MELEKIIQDAALKWLDKYEGHPAMQRSFGTDYDGKDLTIKSIRKECTSGDFQMCMYVLMELSFWVYTPGSDERSVEGIYEEIEWETMPEDPPFRIWKIGDQYIKTFTEPAPSYEYRAEFTFPKSKTIEYFE